MSNYVIYTDSGCDVDALTLEKWGVKYKSLTFRFNGEDKKYANCDMPEKEFYDKMRNGGVAKTAAVNVQAFYDGFEELLKKGNDILYLGFSSGLSTTANSARLAAEQLRPLYPERKIITVDTLMASSGQGLYVSLVLDKKNAGATIEEAAAYAEDIKFSVCAWFTVDDLVYLKRGGRVSPTVAFVGNALGIKPIMHVDNEGHLVKVTKARGRKASIEALANKIGENALDPKGGRVYISHGDCIDDANLLADMINAKYGCKVEYINYVGPVIGAHSGPGTIALFFVGKER